MMHNRESVDRTSLSSSSLSNAGVIIISIVTLKFEAIKQTLFWLTAHEISPCSHTLSLTQPGTWKGGGATVL